VRFHFSASTELKSVPVDLTHEHINTVMIRKFPVPQLLGILELALSGTCHAGRSSKGGQSQPGCGVEASCQNERRFHPKQKAQAQVLRQNSLCTFQNSQIQLTYAARFRT